MAMAIGKVNVPDGIDGAGASDGQVWTANGANGAGFENAAGGSGVSAIPFLGNVGQPDTNATAAEITTAFTSFVGSSPINGSMASFVNNGGPEFTTAICHADQGIWLYFSAMIWPY